MLPMWVKSHVVYSNAAFYAISESNVKKNNNKKQSQMLWTLEPQMVHIDLFWNVIC